MVLNSPKAQDITVEREADKLPAKIHLFLSKSCRPSHASPKGVMLRIISSISTVSVPGARTSCPGPPPRPPIWFAQEPRQQVPTSDPAMLSRRPPRLLPRAEKKGYSGVAGQSAPPDRVIEGIGNAEFRRRGAHPGADFGQPA